jgi:hypothetical protein
MSPDCSVKAQAYPIFKVEHNVRTPVPIQDDAIQQEPIKEEEARRLEADEESSKLVVRLDNMPRKRK